MYLDYLFRAFFHWGKKQSMNTAGFFLEGFGI